MVVIIMMTSNEVSLYTSPTTEDDGYVYQQEEKEELAFGSI
jgi:hypothetical protein